MRGVVWILVLLLAVVSADGSRLGWGRVSGGTASQAVCGEWVHLSNYGQAANLVDYVYEFRVVLNCNTARTLAILAADSATAITVYYVEDWTADTLRGFVKRTVLANARDSIFVARGENGTAPSGSSVFAVFADFNTDFLATAPVAGNGILSLTRMAVDTGAVVPVFDTTGTTEDGYREIDKITVWGGDTICFGTSWTGTYGRTTKYVHLWRMTNSVWSDEGVIADSAFNGEQPEALIFSGGDSLGVYFESSQRVDGYNQVGFVATADLSTWTAMQIVVDSSYIFGGNKSPSSPTALNHGDSLFQVACEVKGNQAVIDGVTYLLGSGLIYLYQGSTPRNLSRVIIPHLQEGDTLVPLVLPFADSTWNDSAAVPDNFAYWSGLGWVLSAHSGYTSGDWDPLFLAFDSLPWSDYDYTVLTELSGPLVKDSLWPDDNYIGFWDSDNGLYGFQETADYSKVYLYKAAQFDTTGHGLTGWKWVRADGAVDALGFAAASGGTLKLMGEQTKGSAMGIRSAVAIPADSFEVIWRMRNPARSGTAWNSLAFGAGAMTDREDNASFWQVPALESGVLFQYAPTTSLLYNMPASGAKQNLDTSIPSPALTSWVEWRFRNHPTVDDTSVSRYEVRYNGVASDYFTDNSNGSGDDWNAGSNYLQLSGGASGTAAQHVAEFCELDYVYVRPMAEVDLCAAPGVVTRDSIPITAMNHTYQSTSSNNLRLNWGADTRAVVANRNASFLATTLAWFSMASIPDTAQILSAVVVFADSNRTFATKTWSIGAYRLTEDWVEGTRVGVFDSTMSSWLYQGFGTGVGGTTIEDDDSLWATAGGTCNPVFVDGIRFTGATTPARTTYSFDITEFARYWQEHPTENFGIVLKEKSLASLAETANQTFHSDDYATAADKPYVIVYWAAPDVQEWEIAGVSGVGRERAGWGR